MNTLPFARGAERPTIMAVSVVIPARNAGKTIAETLESLIAQQHRDWEAIVVDDGSTDSTVIEASRLAARDPRIRVVQQPSGGVSAARNRGIAEASREWLLFLDADDWLLPHHLERLLERIQEAPGIDLVYAGCDWIGTGGARIPRQQAFLDAGLFQALTRYCVFAIHSCLVRRSVVQQVGGFDTALRIGEDWDLWQRIARTGAKFAYVREVLALYRLRPDSASADGGRFLSDGLEVIARGHRADPRVPCPAPEHALGEPVERLAAASLVLVAWAAGLEIGRGHDPLPLLDHLEGMREPGLQPEDFKWSLFYALLLPSGRTLPDWPEFWPQVEGELRRFLDALEARSGARDLAGRCLRSLADLVLETLPQRPLRLGRIVALNVDVTAPIFALSPGAGIDRVRVEVMFNGRKLGRLDLPVFDGFLPADVVADAVANDFGWTILAHFFRPAEAVEVVDQRMAQSGWAQFLRELFGEPSWPVEKFYSPEPDGREAPLRDDELGWIRVELSGSIPAVRISGDELRVVPAVGGAALGAFAIKGGPRILPAAELRAAIVFECGMELLVAAVREGLLAQSSVKGASLRTRLAAAASGHADRSAGAGARVGRRELGRIDTILSRRGAFPVSMWPEIAEAAHALAEPVEVAEPSRRCSYSPDLVLPSLRSKPEAAAAGSAGGDVRAYARDHFEALFASGADPWDYSNDYERTKYEQTLSLVPEGVALVLELACAEGHFTERLVSKVGHVVAADISRIALERARERCAAHANVSFVPVDLVTDELPGQFDLIVCSEVLYYVGDRDDLARIAAKFAAALLPGGRILLAHAHVLIDEPEKTGFAWALPFGAKAISDAFVSVPGLRLEREIRTPLYRIQRFINAASPSNASAIVEHADNGQLTPEVAAHVRLGGGEPPVPVAAEAKTDRLPILAYHRIAPEGSGALAPYRIDPDVFEEQLRYLKDAGYRSVGLEEWRAATVQHAPLPGRRLMFTFDDGTRDFAEFAWPLLQRYGFGATLFVVAGEVGGENRWDQAFGEVIPLLDWDDLRALRAQGLEIGAHSQSHHHMTALPPEEIVRDAVRCRRALLERLGHPIRSFAYPYGDHDRVVRHLVGTAGFDFGITCDEGRNGLWDDPMQLKRLTILREHKFASFVRILSAGVNFRP